MVVPRAFEDARAGRLMGTLEENRVPTGWLSNETRAQQKVELMTPAMLSFHRMTSEEERTPAWLLNMLTALRHFKSTDPRDRIFSLLGLVNPRYLEQGELLQVNYNLSLLDVALGVFKLCLNGSRGAAGDDDEEYIGHGWSAARSHRKIESPVRKAAPNQRTSFEAP